MLIVASPQTESNQEFENIISVENVQYVRTMQMTPERERFLHKHIFGGEERSLREVKVFNRWSGDYHGADALIPKNACTSCVVSTPYSTST
jgi:hypothetical protein